MGLKIEGLEGESAMDLLQRMAILNSIPAERAARMLEIGTLHGVSAAFWAMNRPSCEVYSLDPFQAAVGTGPGNEANWRKNAQNNQHLLVGTTRDLKDKFLQETIERFDVCFVDGDHSEQGCWYDMEIIRTMKLVKPGGAFIVHDYGTRNPALKGVTLAVDKFLIQRGYRFCQKVGVAVWLEPIP